VRNGLRRMFVLIILSMLVLAGGMVPSLRAENERIACGNSFLAALVTHLLGEEVACILLVDAEENSKREHMLSADILDELKHSRLLLYHPFQSWLIRKMDHLEISKPIRVPLRSRFNLIVPDDYLRAAKDLRQELSKYFPEYTTYMSERFEELCEQVKMAETETLGKVRKSKIMGLPCFAVRSQKRYVEWLGFKVVATFSDTEELTDAKLDELQEKAEQFKVWLVVGCRQDQGMKIAEEIATAIEGQAVNLWGAPMVGMDGKTYSWQYLLDENTQMLLQAVQWH